MGILDKSLKQLAQHRPKELVSFLLPDQTFTLGEALEKETIYASREADKAWRMLDEGAPWILHAEFAVRLFHNELRRALVRATQLHDVHRLPVKTVFLALSQEDCLADLPRRYVWGVGGASHLAWRVDIIPIWTYDAKEALAGTSPVGWTLAPLMKGGDDPETVSAAVQRITALPDLIPSERADLLLALRVFGERRIGLGASRLISMEVLMESLLYDEMLQHLETTKKPIWEQLGRQEGRQEGLRAVRTLIQQSLRLKFGTLPEELLIPLEAVEDLPTLEAFALEAIRMERLEDVHAALAALPKVP